MPTLYETLGVEPTATADEMRAAYRKAAQRTHPDREGGDEAAFKLVGEAFETLGNPEKRKRYDEMGAYGSELTLTEKAEHMLARVLQQVLEQIDPDCENLVSMLHRELDRGVKEVTEGRDAANVAAEKAARAVGRLTHKAGTTSTVLERLLGARAEQAAAEMQQALDVTTEMRKILQGYGYTADKPSPGARKHSSEMEAALRTAFEDFGAYGPYGGRRR